jgi:hypothetical protein
MSVWNVRSDVVNFAPMYLTDEFYQPLDFCPEWPDFEGQIIGENWSCYRAKSKKNKPVANFMDLDPGVLVCDNFAIIKIGDFLSNEVELLPIDVEGIDYKLINIINIVDCLDEDKSEIKYFKNSRDVNKIIRHVFDTDLLINVKLFKIPQRKRTDIFATDAFRDKILQSGLTGLEFRLVY